ncbi:hypothetical protein GCM10017783_24460 [Deinococcus piscis]|uniref:Ribonuclease R n=1 Tax=Deinococcus piscis TaxID=394230 RepID=A0ABQ3KB49_9DEIO|nr:hypothetical protein GCM10017783_24460 [Deinococcus piscis]
MVETEQKTKPTRAPRKKAAKSATSNTSPSTSPKSEAKVANTASSRKRAAAEAKPKAKAAEAELAELAPVEAEPVRSPRKAARSAKAVPAVDAGAAEAPVPGPDGAPAEPTPSLPETAAKPRRTARSKSADGKKASASAANAKPGRRKTAKIEAEEPVAEQPAADTAPASSDSTTLPSASEAAAPAAAAKKTTRQRGSKTGEPAAKEQADATEATPAQPKRTTRRTGQRSSAQVGSSEVEASAAPAVPVTTESPEPLADLPAAQASAEDATTPATTTPATTTQAAEQPAAARPTRQSKRKQTKAAVPAGAEAEANEPLLLKRPKRSKRKSQASEETAELEKLSGVEPVEAHSAEPQREVAAPQPQDEPSGESNDVLASLLPDLPADPDLPAVTTQAEPLSDPAQELLVSQLRSIGRPIHVRDLEKSFTRQKANLVGGWREIEGVLEDLTRAGLVVRTRKKTYGLPGAMNLVRGRFQASAAGFGFVVPDSGREDYYVPAESTLEAWNGDTVLVRPEGHGPRGGQPGRRGSRFDGNPQATVVRIVQRHYSQLVGTLEFSHGYPILKADDFRARHRILLLSEAIEELETGARVVVDLYWPEDTGEDEVFGQVSRVLGGEDDPETETEAVMVKYGLRGEFPPEVLSEAGRIPSEIPDSALRGRLDLRHLNTFTVDGRDAKDFDDAIHIEPTDKGTFLVGVHIADVSHYVRAGSELDGEAYARATSVYLPGRVLPMLPEHLSNGVCSLVPNEDRLTMSALVELSADAEILNVEISPSVIHSKARLTYDEVQAYSEGTSPMPEHARHLEGDLHLLLKVTTKLRQQRLRDGSLDFKMREVKVDVDDDGRMELIPLREETARGMIEDLMLLANKVVAHFLLERNVPTLFRIHEEPTLQRFQDVSQAIGRLGLSFPGGEPTPQAYQDVLKQVRGTPRESVVNTLLLRSMQQAKYAGENLGHFGLAFDEYLHFTSPIRRYPDLMVHRVLRGVLSSELRPGSREVDQLRSVLPSMGEHTSDRERNAAEAERDLTKYYQAKWAQEHQGLSFMGNVSGVVASGLFVALDNGVEGKLHISNLDDDYYIYLEDAQMLKGRSNGRTFRLGDAVAVTISEVKPLARQIDFTVPEEGTELEEIVMSENQPSGNKTQGAGQKVGGQKVRARRREDREQERQQKLSNVRPSQPRFTLEEDTGKRGPQASSGRGRGPRNAEGRSQEGRQGERPHRDGAQGRSRTSGQGGSRRRVITLERPRNEHLRPVNITVQRMYFGDWSVDNMPEDDGQQGGRPRNGSPRTGSRPGGREGQGRFSQGRGRSEGRSSAPNEASNTSGPSGGNGQASSASGEGDRRRRRRRSRRPGSEPAQG